ncbi:MAG TPA: DUF5989 family protein [Kofleriaceae bacterium]|jgi:hypothetical protein
MNRRASLARRLWNRLRTLGRILRHFASRQRWFLVPLLIVLLLSGILLVATGGLSYVAPFIYSIF